MQALMDLRDPLRDEVDVDSIVGHATRDHYPHGLVDLVHRCLRLEAPNRMHIVQLLTRIRTEVAAYDMAGEGLQERHGLFMHRPDTYASLVRPARPET